MTKVLITGGAGFIGSHLADHLLGMGQEVLALDTFVTGSRRNVEQALAHPHFHLTVGSAADQSLLEQLIPQVDQVYHLAASVGVRHIMSNLVGSIQNNIDATVAVLEVASRHGKKVLLTSTSEVYGKSADEPSRETDSLRMGETIHSRWSYACSKALDEYLAFAYFHERALPATVVRLFNTVGDRQTDAYGMVIPTFVRQALLGQPLTIYGDGQQSRCFVYVKDVTWALQRLMQLPTSAGEVYNVGSTESITIDQLADRVLSITGSNSQKQFIPYQEVYRVGFEDAARRVPDISKVTQAIGFKPQHSLDDIIRLTQTYLIQEQVGDQVTAVPAAPVR